MTLPSQPSRLPFVLICRPSTFCLRHSYHRALRELRSIASNTSPFLSSPPSYNFLGLGASSNSLPLCGMLERVSAYVEPATLLFLRRIDPPIRSHRVLGSSFWSNGGDNIEPPPWWPIYLKSIRQIPQSRITDDTVANVSTAKHRKQSLSNQSGSTPLVNRDKRKLHSSQRLRIKKRSYSVPATARVEERDDYPHNIPDRIVDRNGTSVSPERNNGETDYSPLDGASGLPTAPITPPVTHEPELSTQQTQLEELLANKIPPCPDTQDAWRRFVALPDQEAHASLMLAQLAQSETKLDMDRALQAYSIIPVESRSSNDYINGVFVAIGRHRLRLATDICIEEQSRNVGQKCRQILLLHCMGTSFWQVTAAIWRKTFAIPPDLPPSFQIPHDKSWSIIDNKPTVPKLLSSLFEYLANNKQAFLVEVTRPALEKVCITMLWRIVLSAPIMKSVTLQRIKQLFGQAKAAEQLQPDHYLEAIRTLCSKRVGHQRVRLCLRLYRSMKTVFPKSPIPDTVVSQLIALCGRATSPRSTIDLLLKEGTQSDAHPPLSRLKQVMLIYSRRGDVEGVERINRVLMSSPDAQVELKTFKSTLYAHAIRGDVIRTRELFAKWQEEHGTSPDVVSWNILLYAFARSSTPHKAFEVFDEMKSAKVKPDSQTFGTLIGVASKAADTDEVVRLMELASELQVSQADYALTDLMESYLRNDEVAAAETIAENISKDPHANQTRHWNILLRNYAFQADHRALLRVITEMRNHGVQFDDMTYAAIMTSLVRVGQTSKALELMKMLHRSSFQSEAAFHYSIILHGFSMEGKTDMVNLISREMKDRFPGQDLGLQSAKAMSEYQRSWAKAKLAISEPGVRLVPPQLDLKPAVEVASYLPMDAERVWSKQPQPGLRRQSSAQSSTNSTALVLLIQSALRERDFSTATELIEQLEGNNERDFPNTDNKYNLILLDLKLILHRKLQKWAEVDALWQHTLTQTVRLSVSVRFRDQVEGLHQFHHTNSSTEVIHHFREQLDKYNASILSAFRFRFSRPLTTYMLALEAQGRVEEVIDLIFHFEKLGFVLTGKNWNTFVQLMCRSSKPEHHRAAFETFDRVQLPVAPNMKLLIRGWWVDPSAPASLEDFKKVPRKLVEKTMPGMAVPTYFTVVHLAMILLETRKLDLKTGSNVLDSLRQGSPHTFRFIEQLPRLRDKVQRLLLRGGRIFGDPGRKSLLRSVQTSYDESNYDEISYDDATDGNDQFTQVLNEEMDDVTGVFAAGTQAEADRECSISEDKPTTPDPQQIHAAQSSFSAVSERLSHVAPNNTTSLSGTVEPEQGQPKISDSNDHEQQLAKEELERSTKQSADNNQSVWQWKPAAAEVNRSIPSEELDIGDEVNQSVESEQIQQLTRRSHRRELTQDTRTGDRPLITQARSAYLTQQLLPAKSKARRRACTKNQERRRESIQLKAIRRYPIRAAKRSKQQAIRDRDGTKIAAQLGIPVPQVLGEEQDEAWQEVIDHAVQDLNNDDDKEVRLPYEAGTFQHPVHTKASDRKQENSDDVQSEEGQQGGVKRNSSVPFRAFEKWDGGAIKQI